MGEPVFSWRERKELMSHVTPNSKFAYPGKDPDLNRLKILAAEFLLLRANKLSTFCDHREEEDFLEGDADEDVSSSETLIVESMVINLVVMAYF